MISLDRRRVIVTGAGSGIGRAIVESFLQNGAQVIAVLRRPSADENFISHANLSVIVGDVSDYNTSARAVAEAQTVFGGLDCFIANAGVWDFYKKIAVLEPEALEAAFDEIMRVNVRALLYGARAAHSALKESKGAIIATASNASFRAGGGGALYTASKFALRGLVMQLAMEFAPDVRVNAVAPGATDTPLSGGQALDQAAKQLNASRTGIDAMAQHIPLGRVAAPQEHCSLYALLASAQGASYMTGAMLLSDGGLTVAV